MRVLSVVLAVALLFVAWLGGCRPWKGSSAGEGGTEWARIASDEGWPSIPDDEFDSYLDSLVDENVKLTEETPVDYMEPMAIVIGSTPEDPASRGAEPHVLALDGTPQGAVDAMRDLGGMVARSGQRPLAVFLIAEANGSDLTVLAAPSSTASSAVDGTEAERVVLTAGMTVDGRVNSAVQAVDPGADGTYTLGQPFEVAHSGDDSQLRSDLLTAFFEGYLEGRQQQ